MSPPPPQSIWVKMDVGGAKELLGEGIIYETKVVDVYEFMPDMVLKTIQHLIKTNVIDEQLINEKAFLHAIKSTGYGPSLGAAPVIYDIDRSKTSHQIVSDFCEART